VWVIVSCKIINILWWKLMLVQHKLWCCTCYILVTLDIIWPQQLLIDGIVNPKTWHEIIEIRIKVIVEILLLSLLTHARILTFKPYVVNTSLTCKAMTILDVLTFSNMSMVQWPYSQLWFKKWTIKTKMFILLLHIYKSKLIMKVSHVSKAS